MPADIDSILNEAGIDVSRLTRDAFAELLDRIRRGEDARDAIASVMQGFDPAYRDLLAAKFSETLGRFVGSDELRSYPIGEVALSTRLYQHAAETSAVVRRIVQEHAAGWQDARQLALQIYEGYGFQQGNDPLQWPARSPKWPKYMRAAVTTDPASFDGWLRNARRMAGNLKTPQLKAAYLEALDAVEKGAGQKLLARKLDVAFQERLRYFANRIAQTELHRQWMDAQAEEIMADDSIQVVQFKLAGSHPKTDICDLFAKQDKFGLGPGMYPKAKAPKSPLHPFCRCRWVSKRALSDKGARENPSSERQYLSNLKRSEGVQAAANVIGGRARLAAALTNAPIDEIINIHRPVPYRLGTMQHAADNVKMKNQVLETFLDPGFGDFSKGLVGGSRQIAIIPVDIRESLGTSASVLSFSQDTAAKQYREHPDITPDDYRRVQDMLDRGEVRRDRALHLGILQDQGRWFYAVIKATKTGNAVWLQSLRRSNPDDVEAIRARSEVIRIMK